MSCNCVRCDECGGSGRVWYSFYGEYLGRYRGDDLDEMDTCPECEGYGWFLCDECMLDEQEAADKSGERDDA